MNISGTSVYQDPMSSFQTYPPISFLSLLGVCRKYLFFSMSSSIFVISDDDE